MKFSTHFVFLAVAVVILIALSAWAPRLLDPFAYSSFALSGLMHALTVVLALTVVGRGVSKVVFVLLAAVLSCLAPQVGMLGAQIVGAGSFAWLVAITSAVGALAYALTLRAFWMKNLPALGVLGIAAMCSFASTAAFILVAISRHSQAALIASWWVAFSVGMYLFGRGRDEQSNSNVAPS